MFMKKIRRQVQKDKTPIPLTVPKDLIDELMSMRSGSIYGYRACFLWFAWVYFERIEEHIVKGVNNENHGRELNCVSAGVTLSTDRVAG
jgi:hypothetical protein